jgi:hypothetical protein
MRKAEIEQRRQAFIRFMEIRGLNANDWTKRAGISSPSVIYNYVRKGPKQTASISHDHLVKLAAAERVRIEDMFDPEYNVKKTALFSGDMNGNLTVDEVDLRAGMGGIGLVDHQNNGGALSDLVVDQWVFPKSLFADRRGINAGSLRIITVRGNSMAPLIEPNSRVLVDTDDRIPTPPGIFVVFDGLGVMVKKVEHVAFSDPPRVKLSSVNPDYEPYERTLEEAHIQGRVIGQWRWL